MDKYRTFISKVNVILFILMYAFRSFTDAIFVAKGVESNIWVNVKYIILAISCVLCFIQLSKNVKKLIFKKEFKSLAIVIISLSVISFVMVFISGKYYSSLLENIFKLALPCIYVFLLLNTMEFKDIYICMSGALILSFVGYIIEIGPENFTLSNILSINFSSSYSPFESNFAAGSAIAMCTFFMYFRKNKILKYLSLIFAILTFKRLAVLFALVLFFLPKIINVNKQVSKRQRNFIKIAFVILTFGYFWLLTPQASDVFENIFGQTQREFSMGRSDFLQTIINGNYISSGLGSTTDFLGRGLEMDLIRIYLETGILGLIIFIFGYWNCAGNCVYTYIYMLFQFVNLLTSHSLSNSFNWILAFIIIGTITYKSDRREQLNDNKIERIKIYEKCGNNNN